MRDERVAQPFEGFVDVCEIAVGDLRRAPQKQASRAPAITSALTAEREGLRERSAKRVAPVLAIALRGRKLEREERLFRNTCGESELVEALCAFRSPVRRRDLGGPSKRRQAVSRHLAASDLALVHVDDGPRVVDQRRKSGE